MIINRPSFGLTTEEGALGKNPANIFILKVKRQQQYRKETIRKEKRKKTKDNPEDQVPKTVDIERKMRKS